MARGRRGPTLYELIRDPRTMSPGPRHTTPTAPSTPPSVPAHTPIAPCGGADDGPNWLSPGRSVRIPVGYLFLFVAIGVGLLFGGYWLGHTRAAQAYDRDRAARNADLLGEPVQDPLGSPAPVGNRVGGNQPVSPPVRPTGAAAVPTGGDPRVSGLNYYIVATLTEPEARRAAEFLAANGVAAAALPANNGRYEVVALRGFSASEIRSRDAATYKSNIQRLGRIYKAEHRGVDFADLYPKKQR